MTNTDKVTILLNEHHKIVRKKTEWLSPAGIFLSVLATLLTAKFDEPKFGVSPELWKAIFLVVCFVTLALSIYLIIMALYYWNRGTVEEFIKKLKNQSPTQNTSPTIEILSATYQWKGGQVEVTNKIKELVSKGVYTITVNPSTFGISDPAQGILKTLKIHCKIRGEEREFAYIDEATFRIE